MEKKIVVGNKSLTVKEAQQYYKLYWKFIKDKIEGLPLKETSLTREDFNKPQYSYNICGLGKLYTTYDKYIKTINKLKYYKTNIQNEGKED